MDFSLNVQLEPTVPFTLGHSGDGLDFTYREVTPLVEPSLSLGLIPAQTLEDYTPDPAVVLTPSNLHDLTVPQTFCRVGTLDVTSALEDWDYAVGIGKLATGQASFVLNPGVPPSAFVFGNPVLIQLLENGQLLEEIRCLIVADPAITNTGGTIRVSVTLGSQAQLEAAQKITRTYCGLPPQNARELAEITCVSLGATPGDLPEGHTLSEVLEDQAFRGLQTIVDAYAVTDHDVHENFRGILLVTPHDNSKRLPIPADSYMKVEWKPPAVHHPRTTTVTNQYNHDKGYPESSVTTGAYSQNYDTNNTMPWFRGGWTYTERTVYYKGSTAVKTVSKTFGYVPNTFPVRDDDLPSDGCVIVSPVPTTYKLIATETITNFYTPVFRTSLVLWRTDRVVEGLNAYRRRISATIPYDQWESYTGTIAREVTQYANTQEDDPTANLCSFQKIWHQTTIKSWQFGILRNTQYALQSINETTYSRGAMSNEVYGNFTRRPILWSKNTKVTRYDEVHGRFNETPVTPEGIEDPPSSVFLLPLREQVQVEGSYTTLGESVPVYTNLPVGATCDI